jgi:hypothetical protein
MEKYMKRILASIAIALLPLTALAHGPSPQKLEKEIVIKAPPAKVWAIVKDFGNLQKWLPLVATTKVESKKDENGDPATYRTLTLKDGGIIIEKLGSINEADMKIKYYIDSGVLPVKDYNATITVKAGPGAGETTVTWMARFYRKYSLNPPIPPGEDDESALKAVTAIFDSGLPNLKKVAESK